MTFHLPEGERLVIIPPLREHLLALAAADPDEEICGLLLGAEGRVDAIAPALNVAPDRHATFEIDPGQLVAAHRAERNGGPTILGHYHSHPRGEPMPSARDRAAAAAGSLWLILGCGTMRAWRAGAQEADEFVEVNLIFT